MAALREAGIDRGETGGLRTGSFCIGLVATVYCLWALVGAEPALLAHAVVLLLISAPLYPFFMRKARDVARQYGDSGSDA